jgi:hypothetical protein
MTALRGLFELIAKGDEQSVLAALAADPKLAKAAFVSDARGVAAHADFFPAIGHYAYEGDTALHMAAAAYRPDLVSRLIALGADVAAPNRRKAQPLHYAVDGGPGGPCWRPGDQAKVVSVLIGAGADPNAVDQGGVTPLHRAVRNRCAEAVRALLAGGADAGRRNKAGSTPMRLTEVTTGRGGSGSVEAKAQLAAIVPMLAAALRRP